MQMISRPLDSELQTALPPEITAAHTLHHLIKSKEMLASMLVTWNNLHYYQKLMEESRTGQ